MTVRSVLGVAACLTAVVSCLAAETAFDIPRFWPVPFGEAKIDAGVVWKDGSELPQEGRAFKDAPLYQRLPNRLKPLVPTAEHDALKCSTSIAFRFVTNTKMLRFRWCQRNGGGMHHMPPNGTSGIDVYRRDKDGKHHAIRTLTPRFAAGGKELYSQIPWRPGEECLVYLPPYDGVRSFAVGVDAGCEVTAPQPHRGSSKPVVLYGHSITQGGCASRPGLIWSAWLGRLCDVEVINFGMSGLAHMDGDWPKVLAEIDASVYVIDNADNIDAKMFDERYEKFLKDLNARRPDVPMILMQNTDLLSPVSRSGEVDSRILALFNRLKKEDPQRWRGLYLLKKEDQIRSDEGTVDGIHLNDLGMKEVGEAVAHAVREAISGAVARPLPYDFTRRRYFSGWDGKMSKSCPAVATDGKGTALMTWQMLQVSGSDVFKGTYMAKSTDGGMTWGDPKAMAALKETRNGKRRVEYTGTPRYSFRNKRWFGLGHSITYEHDGCPLVASKAVAEKGVDFPIQLFVDAKKGEFTGWRPLPLPFAYSRCLPFGDWVELENGDILVAFYYQEPDPKRVQFYRVVTVRYRFEGENLEVVQAGTPLIGEGYVRGFYEPSLAKLNGRYYLTIRTDEQGLIATSDDGLTFASPEPWRWDDGTPLANRNTQQHWLGCEKGLYLTYTREDATNGHVFRNRAPIYMAWFDPVRNCLVKSTERTLVPELGTRLGNFVCCGAGKDAAWLVTAEWMQPKGCDRYGSDNSIWLVQVDFSDGAAQKAGKPVDPEDGFVPLFNGKDLTGWEGATNTYCATADGCLTCLQRDGIGESATRNLWTVRDYTNFVIRFDVKLPPNANNGLGIRTPPNGWCSREGMELQLLDDWGDAYNGSNVLANVHYTGSIYGIVGPARRVNGDSYLNKPGEWNSVEAVADGSRIVFRLNGTTIVDADVSKFSTDGTIPPDGVKRPGLHNTHGRIHWCGHGHDIYWRNIRLKELP